MDTHFSLELAREQRSTPARRHALPAPIEAAFAVPWAQSVGTLELNNALSRLDLHGGALTIEVILRDYADVVSTGAELYADWAQDRVIAYAGRRRLHLIDVSSQPAQAHGYFLTGLFDEAVRAFSPLGVTGRRYLAILARLGDRSAPLRVVTLDCASGQALRLGETTIAPTAVARVCDGAILVYDRHQVRALDYALQPTSHPLIDALGRLEQPAVLDAGGPGIEEIELVGDLPAAIVVTDDGAMWLISWPDPLHPAAQLLARAREVMGVCTSPDVGWVRFSAYSPARIGSGEGLYAMQVRPERLGVIERGDDGEDRLALALDPPIHLARDQAAGEIASLCWVHGPTGLVACDKLGLDHWELAATP